ncbi:MAG: hypothetical protein HY764_04555 [Candidatus Portnoybacteria bacterium]|nr:hypothetical protein [Candidatus Portnoybacteria bacterium]
MTRSFIMSDRRLTGHQIAGRLESTLGRNCHYSPFLPDWQKGEGSLVDNTSAGVVGKVLRQEGGTFIEISGGRGDFIASLKEIAVEI